ncbi:T9SS type B sorting domain-containing protein [Filimonas lacunae]|nr:gliding motility-associated C-terminal domain-containing protein [Filimonas lacunae]BAV05710.1 hypothetical protein FLA_1722 [Filimonas lacunae]
MRTLFYIITILLINLLTAFNSEAQTVTCKDSAFRKAYSVTNEAIRGIHHATLPNDVTLITGSYTAAGAAVSQGMAMLLNAGGNIQTALTQALNGTTTSLAWEMGVPLKDGGILLEGSPFIAVPVAGGSDNMVLAKTDASLNLQWAKSYTINPALYGTINNQIPGIVTHFVTQIDNGDFILAYSFLSNFSPAYTGVFNSIARINGTTGDIIWSKDFMSSTQAWGYTCGVFQQGNSLEVLGFMEVEPDIVNSDIRAVYAMKLALSDGTIEIMKRHRFSNIHYSGYHYNFNQFRARKTTNGYELYGELFEDAASGLSNRGFMNVQLDDNCNVVVARAWDNDYTALTELHETLIDTVGNIIFLSPGNTGTLYSIYATTGSAKRTRMLNIQGAANDLTGMGWGSRIAFKSNAITTVMCNNTSSGLSVIELAQLTPADTVTGCTGKEMPSYNMELPFGFIDDSHGWDMVNDNGLVASPVTLTVASLPVQETDVCKTITTCTGIHISGEDSICAPAALTAQYTGRTTGVCAKVIWQTNTSPYATLQTLTDSTVSIQYTAPDTGSVSLKLYAVAGGCGVVQDSLEIRLFAKAKPVSDKTFLCVNDSALLTPGHWFQTYLWQDGFADSVYKARLAGAYQVKVTSWCNTDETVAFTINGNTSKVSLGNDTQKCNNDSLALTATPGYSSYNWLNTYHLLSTGGNTVKVFPDKDTAYIVEARTTDGCITLDTVQVAVLLSPAITLGNDTSFCTGQKVVLNAGNVFNSFQWSTGATTPIIEATAAGSYQVKAQYSNGCFSADTLVVNTVYALPVLHMPDKLIVCRQQNDVLQPGAGFVTYEWQDGSSAATYLVTQPGNYWVKVTDAHACETTGTTAVTRVADKPGNFIDTDTAMCTYASVVLQPYTTFSSYVWSTGATQPSITVNQPGSYTLQVTDTNGCIGEEVVVVSAKACANSIYFPSAFTPDGNGKNDQFKPLVTGAILKYHFSIYNRWGQCIFNTDNPANSWNGFYKSKSQEVGNYVWMCSYQFAGEKEKVEKGSVVLIR